MVALLDIGLSVQKKLITESESKYITRLTAVYPVSLSNPLSKLNTFLIGRVYKRSIKSKSLLQFTFEIKTDRMANIYPYLTPSMLCLVIGCTALNTTLFNVDTSTQFVNSTLLINRSVKILCSFNATMVYVYFENSTARSYPGYILRKLNECGTSYVSLRNRFKTAPLKVQDDGVLMYLVLIIKDASQQIDLSIVRRKSASKHLSYFLVIVENSTNIDESWLRSAFEKFWEMWILNAVIMFWRNDDLQIFTYSPFTTKFLRQLNSNVTQRNDIFPPDMPNMNGQNLSICLYPDEVRAIFHPNGSITGIDGFMTYFVTERLNATRIMKNPDSSEYSRRNLFLLSNITSADYCVNEVRIEEADMGLNTKFLVPESFQNLIEYTVVFGRDDLCILVPKAAPASLFWNIFRSFEIPVWVAIIMMFLVTYSICRILLPRVDHLLLKLYSSMLTQPLNESMNEHSRRISARFFLIVWFMYCLLISGAYKCNLTSNLVFHISLPQIDSLKQLAQSNYGILTYTRHQKYLERYLNSSVSHIRAIKRKAIPVGDAFLLGKIEENDLSYAYLEKYHVAQFRVNARRHTRNGRPLFHLMRSCPVPFQSVYVVPYGSPYLGFLNTLVRWAHEHGFVEFWNKVMDTRFKNSGKSVIRNGRDDNPVVLTFAHLQAAFCLLVLGLAAGIGVLLWEICQIYGIRTFIYNRQRWKAQHIEAIQNALLTR